MIFFQAILVLFEDKATDFLILRCFGYTQRTVYDYLSKETNNLRHNKDKWYDEHWKNVVAAQKIAMRWPRSREGDEWVHCVFKCAEDHGGTLNYGKKEDLWLWPYHQ